MTENEQQTEAPPVRVPNVSAGARSGLDHQVIGANAQAAHEANEALAQGLNPETSPDDQTAPILGDGVTETLAIPEDLTTVPALLDWVDEGEDDAQRESRRQAVLTAEMEQPEDDRRTTLLEGLESRAPQEETPPAGQ